MCVCEREREALLASKTSVLTTMHTTVRCIHSAVSRPHPLLCGHRVHTTTPGTPTVGHRHFVRMCVCVCAGVCVGGVGLGWVAGRIGR